MKLNPLAEKFIPIKSDLNPLAEKFIPSYTTINCFNIFKNFELRNLLKIERQQGNNIG